MTLTDLITAIKAAIYPNGAEEITGQILQDTLVQMAQTGVTPSGDPMHYAYVACGATWNDSTGFWELNGLTDITNDQMRAIYVYGLGSWNRTGDSWVCAYQTAPVRTTLPSPNTDGSTSPGLNLGYAFQSNSIEVVQILQNAGSSVYASSLPGAFQSINCKSIVNPINVSSAPPAQLALSSTFYVPQSEKIYLSYVHGNVNFSALQNIGLDSLTYLVNNANNSSAITVTVHPTIYGYLTDQSGHSDWYALAQTAAGKNISFVSA